MAADPAERFRKDKYLFVPGFLAPEVVGLAYDYALLRKTFFTRLSGEGQQIPGTHSVYGDTLMETLLAHNQPKMEELTGLSLFPTYSFYRVYKPGDELKKHRDRPSCEISVTICLGFNYITDEPDYSWGIFVADKAFNTTPGDAVVYRGCEVEHWREPFRAQENSWHAQLFLHYVDASREGAAALRFDRRPYIGAPIETRRPE
jgi:hypothetical protein